MATSTDKKNLGDMGEVLAEDYLIKKGYKIVTRNYRCLLGEVDIIANKGDTIVFVEVKTRKPSDYYALDSVDQKKQKKIIDIAKYYQLKLKSDADIQFDVVGITLSDEPVIEHIENAFTVT